MLPRRLCLEQRAGADTHVPADARMARKCGPSPKACPSRSQLTWESADFA